MKNNTNLEDNGEDIGQKLCNNLSRNILLEHLILVRRGINKPDKIYYEALKIEKHLQLWIGLLLNREV
jgi:hypothetical protein